MIKSTKISFSASPPPPTHQHLSMFLSLCQILDRETIYRDMAMMWSKLIQFLHWLQMNLWIKLSPFIWSPFIPISPPNSLPIHSWLFQWVQFVRSISRTGSDDFVMVAFQLISSDQIFSYYPLLGPLYPDHHQQEDSLSGDSCFWNVSLFLFMPESSSAFLMIWLRFFLLSSILFGDLTLGVWSTASSWQSASSYSSCL